MAVLKSDMNENYDAAIIDELSSEDMVQLSPDGDMIALTEIECEGGNIAMDKQIALNGKNLNLSQK